jgi:hypothetical protein
MHKLLAIGGAAALALWASAASADETTGTISKIDHTKNIFVVDGVPYAASPNNTVGVKLSQLKVGDRVTFEYTDDPAEQKWPINTMVLKRATQGQAESRSPWLAH